MAIGVKRDQLYGTSVGIDVGGHGLIQDFRDNRELRRGDNGGAIGFRIDFGGYGRRRIIGVVLGKVLFEDGRNDVFEQVPTAGAILGDRQNISTDENFVNMVKFEDMGDKGSGVKGAGFVSVYNGIAVPELLIGDELPGARIGCKINGYFQGCWRHDAGGAICEGGWRTSCMACHDKMAHLTREGNFHTPEKAASFPISGSWLSAEPGSLTNR